MRQRVVNWIDCIIGGLLALLGFSSCDKIGDEPCEYGTPNADYKMMGTVTDEAGNPLKGIQVAKEELDKGNKYPLRDTVYTDASGKFSFSANYFPLDRTVNVTFNDIDGSENGGEFESQTITGVVYEKTKESDQGWYKGEFTANVNAELKKKTGK